MSYSVAGRLALVTGAARGLGRSLVDELLERRARVVAVDVATGALETLAEEAAADGIDAERLLAVPLDVSEPEAIRRLRDRLHAERGRLEILVNNAGVVHGGLFIDVPLERHLETLGVNLGGVVSMTHAFLPDLCAADAGRLVNVASASAFVGLPWAVTYSASKWGVAGFSEGIRQELRAGGHHRVAVTAVCPAYIDTGLFRGARPPHLMRALAAPVVARRTVRAMCRGRRRLLMPLLARSAPWMVALPSWLGDPVSRVLGVATSMRSWRGR